MNYLATHRGMHITAITVVNMDPVEVQVNSTVGSFRMQVTDSQVRPDVVREIIESISFSAPSGPKGPSLWEY